MELLSSLYKAMETCNQATTDSFESKPVPWNPSDLTTDGRILVWKVTPQFLFKLLIFHLCLM